LTRTAAGRRSAPKPGARCLCPTPTHAFSINPALWRAAGSVDQTAPAPLTSPAYAWHPEGHRLPWPRTADDHEARDRRVGGGRLALGVAAAALLRAKVNPPGWLRSSATNCSRAAGGSRPEPGSHGKLSVVPAARLAAQASTRPCCNIPSYGPPFSEGRVLDRNLAGGPRRAPGCVACMLAAGRACWAQAACMHSQRAEQLRQPRMERSSVQSLGRRMITLHLELAKRARMRGCSPKAAGAAVLGRAPG